MCQGLNQLLLPVPTPTLANALPSWAPPGHEHLIQLSPGTFSPEAPVKEKQIQI
jgi:hypothetical protein